MKNLCAIPWVGFSNDPDGSVKPCCISQETVTKPDGSNYYTQLDNIKDIFHSEYMNNLRQEFIDGKKPKNCSVCWINEDNGYTSKRETYNEVVRNTLGPWATPENLVQKPLFEYPIDFQVILTNACNLKCRSCGSSHSTEWYKELQTMPIEDIRGISTSVYELPHGQAGGRKSEFITSMEEWLPYAKRIEIVGGEPFYTKNWENAWELMIEKGVSKNISLNMSTNGTIFREKLIKRLGNNFKHVGIALSIDGIGKTFEYLRKNAKWDSVKKNLLRFNSLYHEYDSDNLYLGYTYTLSWVNAYELPEFHDWIQKNTPEFVFWINIIHIPEHLCLYSLPEESKIRIQKKWENHDWGEKQKDIDGIIKYMFSKSRSNEYLKKLYTNFTILDKYRKESTFDVVYNSYPELKKYV
tara:strand:- start:5543 stop:6772 length:1230 start_codon:yes stop_codon:yes gene_type:complete